MTVLSEIGDKTFFAAAVRSLSLSLSNVPITNFVYIYIYIFVFCFSKSLNWISVEYGCVWGVCLRIGENSVRNSNYSVKCQIISSMRILVLPII